MEGGEEATPFVRMFYGEPSVYLWEDEHGVVHNIYEAEGGEQGDALMPLLFALSQHSALVAVQGQLVPGERLMAFLVRHLRCDSSREDWCSVRDTPE